MSESQEIAGFFDWKLGQKGNINMMFVGIFCLLGIPMLCQLSAFRKTISSVFGVSNDAHWILVLFPVCGLYMNEIQLAELERQNGIQTAVPPTIWTITLFFPIIWPFLFAAQMDRLNAIAAKVQQ